MAKHSILIVDTDRNLAQVLGALFNSQGIRVHHVTRLRDAVAKLSLQKYSVVLLEPALADESGAEVIRAAQDPTGLNQRTPFVVMTRSLDHEIPVSVSPLVQRVLLKPFQVAAVNSAVLSVLSK